MRSLLLALTLAVTTPTFASAFDFEKPAWWASVPAPKLVKGADWARTWRLSNPATWVALSDLRVLGAFVAIGPSNNFATDFGPEKSPLDLNANYPGPGGSTVRWQAAPATWTDPDRVRDLLLFDIKKDAAAYVTAEFNTLKAERLVALGGSDDTFTLWVNGKRLVAHEVYRGAAADQERAEFKSKPGKNTLLLKVCQGAQGWGFYLDLRRIPAKDNKSASALRRMRARELDAFLTLHPEDAGLVSEAFIEIADIFRQEGQPELGRKILSRYTEGHTAASWPAKQALRLSPGERLMVIGDSITQQRMYTRLMETYLRVCAPELNVDFRQQGWNGQSSWDALARLDADVIALKPTKVLLAYGPNDTRYDNFKPAMADEYESNTRKLVTRLKKAGITPLLTSSSSYGNAGPSWRVDPTFGPIKANHQIALMRDRAAKVAAEEGLAFSDSFTPLLHLGVEAMGTYGRAFRASGDDGLHPEWAGHFVVAAVRLLGLGLDGDLGTITLDLASGQASVQGSGHSVLSSGKGRVKLRSTRYPFCIGKGDPADAHTWNAGAKLAGFHERLNRLTLKVAHAGKGKLRLRWGKQSKVVKASALEAGVNLAELFETSNPFSAAFAAVDQAVTLKQEFETKELQEIMHGPLKGEALKEAIANAERQREVMVKAIEVARVPIEHVIKVEAIR